MTLITCLSVFFVFAAAVTDGSPVGQEDLFTNARLYQGQESVATMIPEEHTLLEAEHVQSQKSTDILASVSNRARTEDLESPEPQLRIAEQADPGYVFYESVNGSFKLHRVPAAWRDARLTCYDEGAELASPENEALLEAMSKVLLTSTQPPLHVFTGVNDLYSKGFFTSLRGTPLSKMPAPWAPYEPDNINHEDNCLVLQRNGLLLDSKCDDVYPYICYKRIPPNYENRCGHMEYVYDKSTNSCYKFHTDVTIFRGAYATCIREGGYLAIPNSANEAKVLARQFPKDWGVAFIGFSYWRKDLWMTVHGETLNEAGYATWGNGEPNDDNTERCGSIYSDGNLNDMRCERLSGYICEKKSLM